MTIVKEIIIDLIRFIIYHLFLFKKLKQINKYSYINIFITFIDKIIIKKTQ